MDTNILYILGLTLDTFEITSSLYYFVFIHTRAKFLRARLQCPFFRFIIRLRKSTGRGRSREHSQIAHLGAKVVIHRDNCPTAHRVFARRTCASQGCFVCRMVESAATDGHNEAKNENYNKRKNPRVLV